METVPVIFVVIVGAILMYLVEKKKVFHRPMVKSLTSQGRTFQHIHNAKPVPNNAVKASSLLALDNSPKLTLMTYNMYNFRSFPDQDESIDNQLHVINSASPDIFVVQEATFVGASFSNPPQPYVDKTKWEKHFEGYDLFYAPYMQDKLNVVLGVLKKYKARQEQFSSIFNAIKGVCVTINGVDIRIVGLHLNVKKERGKSQLLDINVNKKISREWKNVFIMGDFNLTKSEIVLDNFKSESITSGSSVQFTGLQRKIEIDHIYYKGDNIVPITEPKAVTYKRRFLGKHSNWMQSISYEPSDHYPVLQKFVVVS